MRIAWLPLLLGIILFTACGDPGDGVLWGHSDRALSVDAIEVTTVSGAAYRFDWSFTMLPDAALRILEHPNERPVYTNQSGRFTFHDVPVDEPTTFVLEAPDFFPTQTATLLPGKDGIGDVAFQVPPTALTWAMSLLLFEVIDPDKCQIASTVTEPGGNPWSQGIEGAQVFIDPPLPPDRGPFYFMIVEIPGWPIIDLPLRWLTETTGDGGVIFINVPPGDYVISAEKDGEEFTSAYLKCRPGVLVNAAPPYGLQRID
ncbi:MAG: hypothetical protein P9L99_13780 [Candidatus Lernaella stagnicola]|nr:hypothetical protein [Candidatus Lernaella stagnicola]